jgi:hypothetical protein
MEFDLVPAVHLAANASVYDRRRGLPDAEVTHLMWIVWSSASFVVALACCLVFVAVLASPKTRASRSTCASPR